MTRIMLSTKIQQLHQKKRQVYDMLGGAMAKTRVSRKSIQIAALKILQDIATNSKAPLKMRYEAAMTMLNELHGTVSAPTELPPELLLESMEPIVSPNPQTPPLHDTMLETLRGGKNAETDSSKQA